MAEKERYAKQLEFGDINKSVPVRHNEFDPKLNRRIPLSNSVSQADMYKMQLKEMLEY